MLARRHPSHPVALLASIVGLGVLLTFINRDLPIVRNALLYAQIHHHLVEHGMRVWQVCGDPQLVFDKACGFPALASPLIALPCSLLVTPDVPGGWGDVVSGVPVQDVGGGGDVVSGVG